MANGFSKEETVAFEEMCQGFEDALVLSRMVTKYDTDQQTMERSNDTIWRPQPYIMQSFDGSDASSNFGNVAQLSVPASIGYQKHSTAMMTAKELRDMLQEGRLGKAATQKLASDINVSIMSAAAMQGTIFVKRGTASGYADIAKAEESMNRVGVSMFDRYLALSSQDYNSLAADIAGRQTPNQLVRDAYSKSLIGDDIAGFQTHKLDYALRQTAPTIATGLTINGANQYYTPKATSTATTGEVSNVDNRYQNLTVTVGAGDTVRAGDSFTIADVYEVHHITKQSTGSLKTFRIIDIVSGGGTAGTNVLKISPAIVSNGGSTDAEAQYQNVDSTPANGAAITFLNTVTNYMNPFWHKDSLEILPGRLSIDTDAGAKVLRTTVENGIEVVMQKQFDINTQKTKFRWDVLYGVANKQPEMSGIVMFSQT